MRSNSTATRLIAAILAGTVCLAACDREPAPQAGTGRAASDTAAKEPVAPTNRVDIPAAVRRNLGITFAKVEYRKVAHTLRVPGSFELLPTARREYRAPLTGRIELLVEQYQKIEVDTPLYRVESATWRDLHERIEATRARVESMTPLREAHRVHEQSLAERVSLWQERLRQLEALREAGGGSAAQFTEARAALNTTQAELANVMEKDAELQAMHKQAEAELRALESQRRLIIRDANATQADGVVTANDTAARDQSGWELVVRAVAPGVVEAFGVTPGGLAETNGLVLSVVQPELIRFRARGLQADIGRLRDGLPTSIVSPLSGGDHLRNAMSGALRLGLVADADERTIDLIVEPESLANWAKAGVSAQLEITLDGGNEELAIPVAAVIRDGATPIIFRRDPSDPDKAIRMEADIGLSDGRWIVIASGVKEGDEIVVGGNYQLMLATSGSATKGGHFHPDGTFHEGDH